MRSPSLCALHMLLGCAVSSLPRAAMAQESHGDTVITARQSRVSLPPLVASHRLERLTTLAPLDAGPCSARRAVIGGAVGAGIGLLSGFVLMALKLGDPDYGTYSTGDKVRDIAIPTVVLGTLGFFIADATKPSTCK